MSGMVDFTELVKRIIKYLVLGLVISVVAIVIPKKSLNLEEVIILALSAAATFSILDVFVPSMGESVRTGAATGLGINMIGGLRIAGM
jgi:ABC-type Co2+ transport system permease subunit